MLSAFKKNHLKMKKIRAGALNPCHQVRSQTPIPLSYIYRYRARLILTDKSLTQGTLLLYNNVKLTIIGLFIRKCQSKVKQIILYYF